MAFYDWFGAGPQHESVFAHAIPYVPTLVLLIELHHTARRIGLNGGNQVQVGHACRCQSKVGNDKFKGRTCLLTESRSSMQQHRFYKCKPTSLTFHELSICRSMYFWATAHEITHHLIPFVDVHVSWLQFFIGKGRSADPISIRDCWRFQLGLVTSWCANGRHAGW